MTRIAPWLVLLGGCLSHKPGADVDWETYLTHDGACGDGEFFATNPEGTVLYHVGIGGLASSAIDAGQSVQGDFDATDSRLLAELVFGANLAQFPCGGDPDAVVVDAYYTPTAGTFTAYASPNSDGTATGELTATGVVFGDTDTGRAGDPITFESFTVRGTMQP